MPRIKKQDPITASNPESSAPQVIRRVALIAETAVAPRRRMLSGVARYMHEHSPWAIYLKPASVEKSLDKWLSNWNGDGIIAAVHQADVELISRQRIPVVDMMGITKMDNIPVVHANDESIGRTGADHLLERGFKNFGFCGYPEHPDWAYSRARRIGFENRLREVGLTPSLHTMPFPSKTAGGPEPWEAQQNALSNWLNELPKPAAIMASSDMMGQQILEACQRHGIRVPEQVAVLGADNDEPICMLSYPALSSVIINDHQRGYEAAALLDRRMRGEPAPLDPILIEPAGVVSRASTDIMATDDQIVVTAMRFLRQHAIEDISVEDIVAQVPVCRSILERRFRKVVGRRIGEEITRLRLDHAINLLTQTELELKEIADRSGFGSHSYMSTAFRHNLGRSPSSYRNPSRP